MAAKTRAAARTLGHAVDELGVVRARIEELSETEKRLKDEVRDLAAAAEVKEARGAAFKMTLVTSTRSVLDGDAVRKEMGAGWWSDHCRITTSTSIRTTPLASAVLQRAA